MTGIPHLDERRWADLLAGRLPAEERAAVVAHLGVPCETCEAFLAESGAVDRLDGRVDALLAGVGPARGPDQPAFERLRRALENRRRRRFAGVASGLLAAAAVAAFVVHPSAPGFREKGVPVAGAAPILELLARDPSGTLHPLGADAEVHPGTMLFFRIGLREAGCVQLWAKGGSLERLLPEARCLPAGEHVLAQGNEALAMTPDEPGALTFYGARVGEGEDAAVETELQAGGTPARIARFPLRVTPLDDGGVR